MGVDVKARTGVGVKLTLDDLRLVLPDAEEFSDVYNLDTYEKYECCKGVRFVQDVYSGSYLYLMNLLFDVGEYDGDETLEIDLDLDLPEYVEPVREAYKDIFGKELDRDRVKLISMLYYY